MKWVIVYAEGVPTYIMDEVTGQYVARLLDAGGAARTLAVARLICAAPDMLAAADRLIAGPARGANLEQLRGLNDLIVAADKARGIV